MPPAAGMSGIEPDIFFTLATMMLSLATTALAHIVRASKGNMASLPWQLFAVGLMLFAIISMP
jgi:hypothetical protein